MNLRSRQNLNSHQELEIASKGGNTQLVGALESIREQSLDIASQSNIISRTMSDTSMDRKQSRDMHQPPTSASKGKSVNPYENIGVTMNYNMKLQYLYTNAQDAKIYQDPMKRYVVKIAHIFS